MIQRRFEEGAASGILNAPMPASDPHVDPLIHRRYDVQRHGSGKASQQAALPGGDASCGRTSDAPIFFWPHRLVSPQKGVELMLDVIPLFMKESPTAQFAIVASGQPNHLEACRLLDGRLPRAGGLPLLLARAESARQGGVGLHPVSLPLRAVRHPAGRGAPLRDAPDRAQDRRAGGHRGAPDSIQGERLRLPRLHSQKVWPGEFARRSPSTRGLPGTAPGSCDGS